MKEGLTDGDHHVDVDLPVLDSLEEVLHVELVGEGAAVSLEPARDFGTLFLGQEGSGFGVVVNDEECDHSDDASSNALDDENLKGEVRFRRRDGFWKKETYP